MPVGSVFICYNRPDTFLIRLPGLDEYQSTSRVGLVDISGHVECTHLSGGGHSSQPCQIEVIPHTVPLPLPPAAALAASEAPWDV